MKKLFASLATASVLALGGCSEATQPAEKKAEAPPEPVTGRLALYRMYAASRSWASDAEVLRLRSIDRPEVKRERGRAGAWEAYFVSAQLGRARSYTYSVVEAEGNLHLGVFAGLEEGWSGPRAGVKPFLMQALKTDSDAAYETAVKKGKKAPEYIKLHPDMTVMFLLEQNNKFPQLTWRVIWGETVGTSNYSVFVDATTGEYLETMR